MTLEKEISVRKRRGNFTTISNIAITDERLSLDAKGFLVYIVSRPDSWVFRPKHLMRVCGIGKDKYYGIVRQLKSNGYLIVEQLKGTDGKYIGTNWEIIDDPCAENPDTAEPDSGKVGHLLKTDHLENTELKMEGRSFSSDHSDAAADGIKKNAEKERAPIEVHFEEFWRIHPRPRDRNGSTKLFRSAILSGVAPGTIKSAARKYGNETKRTPIQYVATSASWLDQRRWEEYSSPASSPAPDTDEVAQFWAEKVRAGNYISPNAITAQVAAAMVRNHGVSATDLRELGVAV